MVQTEQNEAQNSEKVGAGAKVPAPVRTPALDLEQRPADPPPPPPTLNSTRADQFAPAPKADRLLGTYLDGEFVAIVGGAGSNASALALAIAEVVAAGGEVLGVPAVPAPVLYVDGRRPLEVVSSSLAYKPSALKNLRILSGESGRDWHRIDEELSALRYHNASP